MTCRSCWHRLRRLRTDLEAGRQTRNRLTAFAFHEGEVLLDGRTRLSQRIRIRVLIGYCRVHACHDSVRLASMDWSVMTVHVLGLGRPVGPATVDDARFRAAYRDLRFRRAVLARSVPEAVESAGGLICDRAMAAGA
jgi:hypothetical protein